MSSFDSGGGNFEDDARARGFHIGDPDGADKFLKRGVFGQATSFDGQAQSNLRANDIYDFGRAGSFAGMDGGGEGAGYQNDDFADRFRSESVKSDMTTNSIGNRVKRNPSMFSKIQDIERQGAFPGHRQPVRRAENASSAYSSFSSASSGPAPEAGARRPGFFNGSFNPFKWNWKNLFGRRSR